MVYFTPDKQMSHVVIIILVIIIREKQQLKTFYSSPDWTKFWTVDGSLHPVVKTRLTFVLSSGLKALIYYLKGSRFGPNLVQF